MPERKLSFSPISASDKNGKPRNIPYIPAVKISIFLDLDKKSWFSFRQYVGSMAVDDKTKKAPGTSSKQGPESLYNKKFFGNQAIMTITVLDPRLCVTPLSKGLPFHQLSLVSLRQNIECVKGKSVNSFEIEDLKMLLTFFLKHPLFRKN